jgi:hypothetical protein
MVNVMANISLLRMTVLTWTILMCISPTWNKGPQCLLISRNALSNSQGPIFSGYSDSYADGFSSETIITFAVTVEDPNGIESVIASYRNQTESQWSNITMQNMDENYTKSRYEAFLHVNVSEPGVYVWDIQYGANDTLGLSSVSDVIQYSYRWNPIDLDPTPTLVLVISVVGALVVFGVFMKRGKLRPKS